MANQCVNIITKSTHCPVAYMGIAASKFIPSKESGSFLKFFNTVKSKDSKKINLNINQSGTTSSSESEINFKSNFEVAEAEPSTSINSKDQSPKVEKEKPLSTIIGEEEPIPITVTAAIEKSVATTSEITARESKTIFDNPLKTEAEDSPTSRKLFKLIQVYNECDEAKSKIKRMSNMAINNNDFQNSFFMNIFKTDQKDRFENVDGSSDIVKELELDTKNLDNSNDTDNSNSNLCIQNNDQEKLSSNCASALMHKKDEDSCEKDFKGQSTPQNSPVLLREIFPNLDDIDPDTLLLLPPNLQEEARSYARSRDKQREKLVKISRDVPAKTAKGKSAKIKAASKAKKRSPKLDNFLIKTNSNGLLERCVECGQMIPVTKYDEHTDFHVAQNLYRDINKPENSVKRKLEDAEVVTNAKH